jgi:hypothetical protein
MERLRTWERLADEPIKWYKRFEVFRKLGPDRTFIAAYRAVAAAEGYTYPRVSNAWRAAARRWRWRERAKAWDEVEAARRQDPREQRKAMSEELLVTIYGTLRRIESMSDAQAILALPALRNLLRDVSTVQREEEQKSWNLEWENPLSEEDQKRVELELEMWSKQYESEMEAYEAQVARPIIDGG